MTFIQVYLLGLLLIFTFFTLVWILSVFIRNVSIVDIFWGLGFILLNTFYYFNTPDFSLRKIIVLFFISIWALRLSIHIMRRNHGKPEDYRYQEFRKHYGEKRYWWYSYFQVFLLQGGLLWLISAPLLAVNYYSSNSALGIIDYIGILFLLVGITFETVGDWQLSKFKKKPENKGKTLQTGLWKYTRHPNYFGDATVWWGFVILSISAGCYLPVFSSVLMTWLLIKVSGIAMLERTLKNSKPEYRNYVKTTSAFIPWFPKNVS